MLIVKIIFITNSVPPSLTPTKIPIITNSVSPSLTPTTSPLTTLDNYKTRLSCSYEYNNFQCLRVSYIIKNNSTILNNNLVSTKQSSFHLKMTMKCLFLDSKIVCKPYQCKN